MWVQQQCRSTRILRMFKWLLLAGIVLHASSFILPLQFRTSPVKCLLTKLSGLLNINYDDSRDDNKDNYKFIITMATYQRLNNKTPFYVNRAVRSIIRQTYRNWEVFVTGDQYANEIELDHIFRGLPAKKLFLYNLKVPGERNNLSGFELWKCAGATAINNALDRISIKYNQSKILEKNKLIIAHLDDDDVWHPYHLQNLINAYDRFPQVHFVWSKGYYCMLKVGGIVFPSTNLPDDINNMPPTFAKTLHSSVSWKMKTFISFRYRRVWEFINEDAVASDADLWRRMSGFMIVHNLSYYHSAVVTVEHLEEMGSQSCKKVDKTSLWDLN